MDTKYSLFGLKSSLLAVITALLAICSSDFSRPPGEASASGLLLPAAQQRSDLSQAAWTGVADQGSSNRRRFRVPPRSLVILHSLDITGGLHEFHLRIVDQDDAAEIATVPENAESRGISWTASAAAASELPADIELPCEPEQSPAVPTALPGNRRLLLPQFTSSGLRDIAAECRCLYFGRAVAVYADPQLSLPEDLRTLSICGSLDRHLQRAAGTTRTLIETALGPVDDLDGDGRLTVVLSGLDQRNRGSHSDSNQIPVRGCVREADFLESQGTTGGDILYLDPEGLKTRGGRALLAHELAHAAVHCRQRERLLSGKLKIGIPEWFHEALAHMAELSAAGPGEFFDQRLAEFQICPQTCPVVTDSRFGWQAGRGGSRVAGFLFLQSSLKNPTNVPELLGTCESFEQLLNAALRRSLPECLSAWGPVAAEQILRDRPQAIPCLRAGREQTGLICGTAFRCWRNDDVALTIEVESQVAAALRLSVVGFEDADWVAAAN
jgi:hypothetical protein